MASDSTRKVTTQVEVVGRGRIDPSLDELERSLAEVERQRKIDITVNAPEIPRSLANIPRVTQLTMPAATLAPPRSLPELPARHVPSELAKAPMQAPTGQLNVTGERYQPRYFSAQVQQSEDGPRVQQPTITPKVEPAIVKPQVDEASLALLNRRYGDTMAQQLLQLGAIAKAPPAQPMPTANATVPNPATLPLQPSPPPAPTPAAPVFGGWTAGTPAPAQPPPPPSGVAAWTAGAKAMPPAQPAGVAVWASAVPVRPSPPPPSGIANWASGTQPGAQVLKQAIPIASFAPPTAHQYGAQGSFAYLQRLLAQNATARQGAPVGSPEDMALRREDIALRREQLNLERKDRFAGLVARYGSIGAKGAMLGYGMQQAGELGGNVYSQARNSILGFVGAASPEMIQTFTGSLRLLQGEIGIAFIPAMMQASAWLQRSANWVRDLDSGTKRTVATWIAWTAAIGGGVYGLSRVVEAGTSVVGVLGRVRNGITGVTDTLLRSNVSLTGWGGGARGALAGLVNSRNAPLGIGLAGAGMFAAGQMAGSESAWSSPLTSAGEGAMLAALLSRGGWRATAGLAVPLTVGAYAVNRYMAPSAPSPTRPEGFEETPEDNNVRTQVMQTFYRNNNSLLTDHTNRYREIDALMRTRGLTAQSVGITPEMLQGQVSATSRGPGSNWENALNVSRTVMYGLHARPMSGDAADARARELRTAGRGAEADELVYNNRRERFQMIMSTGYQSQQIGLESLHAQVQSEATRDPIQQRQFEQQMRAMEEMLRELKEINRRAGRPEDHGIVD